MIQSVPSNRLVSEDSIKTATVYYHVLSQPNQPRVVSTTSCECFAIRHPEMNRRIPQDVALQLVCFGK